MPVVLGLVALPEALIALVSAILLTAALALFIYFLQGIAANIPFLGGRIASWAQNVIHSAQAYGEAVWNEAVSPVAAILYTPTFAIALGMQAASTTIGEISDWIAHAPYILSRYIKVGLVLTSLDVLQSDLNRIVADMNKLLGQPYITPTQVVDISTTAAQPVAARGDTVSAEQLTQLRRYFDNTIGVLQSNITALVNDNGTLFNRTNNLDTLVGDISAQIGNLSPDIVGAMIAVAVGAVAGDLADYRTKTDTLVGDIAATLANTTTASIALTKVVDDYLKKCGDPLCETVAPQIPSIKDIGSVIADATLLALVAEAIANPTGAAAAVNDVVSPIVRDVSGLLGKLIPK